jgi:hypothetical protein
MAISVKITTKRVRQATTKKEMVLMWLDLNVNLKNYTK